ncbi:hypothetical protein UlMin_017244 [Ulmus minor]
MLLFHSFLGFSSPFMYSYGTCGPIGPPSSYFLIAEMLPSGYLIQPCEGGGSMIHIVDHVDLDAWSVLEVIRPLYESSKILAQKMTLATDEIEKGRSYELRTTGAILVSQVAVCHWTCSSFLAAVGNYSFTIFYNLCMFLHGSIDIGDALEQPSTHYLSRLKSL